MISILLAAMLQATGPTAQAPPSVIVNPDWLRRPSAGDMMRVYPKVAARAHLAGTAPIRVRAAEHAGVTVELNCRFMDGHLQNCLPTGSPLPPPEAIATAQRRARDISLPPTPRPVGRIVIPLQFVP